MTRVQPTNPPRRAMNPRVQAIYNHIGPSAFARMRASAFSPDNRKNALQWTTKDSRCTAIRVAYQPNQNGYQVSFFITNHRQFTEIVIEQVAAGELTSTIEQMNNTVSNTQHAQFPVYPPITPPVRTVDEFRIRVSGMTQDHQLTTAGKELVKAGEWMFVGDSYRQAWGHLFSRARQLGLTYCKRFKWFYKPLPPKPAIGDRVKLTSTGATGIVTGYSRFDVRVRLDNETREAEVSTEYLEKI